MGDQHCHKNQPVYGQRVNAYRKPRAPAIAPARPYVNTLELLLRHVTYTLDQNQDTHCVLVWHFQLAADYLEVKTCRHLRPAARLKRWHRRGGGVADRGIRLFLAALDHFWSVWNEFLLRWWRNLHLDVLILHLFVLLYLINVLEGGVSIGVNDFCVGIRCEKWWVTMSFLRKYLILHLEWNEWTGVIFPREVFIFISTCISVFEAFLLIVEIVTLLSQVLK